MRLRTLVILLMTLPVLAPVTYVLVTSQQDTITLGPAGHWWLGPYMPVVLFLVPISFVFWMFRRFNRALGQLVAETKRLASGNRTQPIQVKGTAELESLTASVEELRLALNKDQERKSFLLMGLSHDFRTPITLIKGYAEAVEDELTEASPAVKKYLQVIQDKSQQLERMVERWIELVKLETGDRTATFETVTAKAWFEGLWSRLGTDIDVLGRRFLGELAIAPEVRVRLDSALMERVFENLLSNSVKHSAPGQTLRWSVRQNADTLVVDLIDEGSGIDVADQAWIWDPFYRAKTEAQRGWGLGLSVVKSIIEAHGFRIELVESGPGKGTWFRMVMPVEGGASLQHGALVSS